jgi:diguanylate cyclase (GGDEF)-like protein
MTTISGPAYETPCPGPDTVASPLTLTPAAPEEPCEPGVQRRLEDIASTIEEFASLNFNARAEVGPDGDIIDAVAAGVNFLGEELDASFRDIERQVADRTAELVAVTQDLARQALHDGLTGLPNRTLFWDRLTHRISLADRRQSQFAVLFLDLDNFKTVNDTLGHPAGDQLLVDVASRIRASLREGDSAARLGGDEFLVLLDEVASPKEALAIAQRLSRAVRARSGHPADPPDTTTSIGVAVSTDRTWTADEILGAADAAMYDAKRRGPGQCVLYAVKLHDPASQVTVSAQTALQVR